MSDMARQLQRLNQRIGQGEVSERPLSGSGTAFPASPPTSSRFFRTDLGFDCYYDGTRWLTVAEYSTPLIGSDNSVAFASRGTSGFLQYGRFRIDYAPYITRVVVATNVATTNNGTNYWTIKIQGVNTNFTAGTDLWTFNTSADSVATWTHHDGVTTNVPANYHFAVTRVDTTLAPGTITVLPTVFYRLIVT